MRLKTILQRVRLRHLNLLLITSLLKFLVFAFEKFAEADPRLTTTMKSVGEAMALGRSFQKHYKKRSVL